MKLFFALLVGVSAIGATACDVVDNPVVDAVVQEAAAPASTETVPDLRWIREGEAHPNERVNIILRVGEGDLTWRERCQFDLHGLPSRLPTNETLPGLSDSTQVIPVCLRAAAT